MIVDAEYRRALGAYLLGALDRDEEARLTEHLRSCPRCHAELLDLGGVVADLAVLTPAADNIPTGSIAPARTDAAAGTKLRAATTVRRHRGAATTVPRRRLFAVAAVAAVAACLAAAGAVGFTMGREGSREGGPMVAAPASPAGTHIAEGRDSTATVTGRAELTPAAWGTAIQITVAGTQQVVDAGVRCTLLAVSRTGESEPAGSWTVPERSPTPAGERIPAATAIPLRDLSKLLVVTSDGRELLAVSV
jgi:hypothetical protein